MIVLFIVVSAAHVSVPRLSVNTYQVNILLDVSSVLRRTGLSSFS